MKNFGSIDQDVSYESSARLEQWTIKFNDKELPTKAVAIVKVRSSPLFSEMIEFLLELGPIEIEDRAGKEVVVSWRLLNNFNGGKAFWTDSNGLEMQKRTVKANTTAGNFYPVTSALAVRDTESTKQVVIMNDHAQAAMAEVEPGVIQFLHNRRLLTDDGKGLEEPLDETDQGKGLQVNSKYYMHIFDRIKTKSIQRHQQKYIDNPIMQLYAFGAKQVSRDKHRIPYTNKVKDWIPRGFDYQLYPIDKLKILARFTNLAD